MAWPIESLDFNSFGNIWKIIGCNVKARKPVIMIDLWHKLLEQLKRVILEHCDKLQKLYDSEAINVTVGTCFNNIPYQY